MQANCDHFFRHRHLKRTGTPILLLLVSMYHCQSNSLEAQIFKILSIFLFKQDDQTTTEKITSIIGSPFVKQSCIFPPNSWKVLVSKT